MMASQKGYNMGEYDRINKRIAEIEAYVDEQEKRLATMPDDDVEYDMVAEDVEMAKVSIGELEGELEELADVDGYNSYADYCDDQSFWDYMDR